MNYVLKYRAPGKRPETTKWETRRVQSVQEAIAWMNEHKAEAFLPASVLTNAWRPQVIAILCEES